jgi:hypothetical protein
MAIDKDLLRLICVRLVASLRFLSLALFLISVDIIHCFVEQDLMEFVHGCKLNLLALDFTNYLINLY